MFKVRIDGQVVHLPAIKGANGKSAYQYAVEAGFEGTEQEFINLLIEGTDIINSHLTDNEAHTDIREMIDTLRQDVIVKVNQDISKHNTDDASHDDIREMINSLDQSIVYADKTDIDAFFV